MDETDTSRRKVRSPSFPFIGLREALDRARAFYEAEQRNAARPETAAAHWGYSPKSSGGEADDRGAAGLRAAGRGLAGEAVGAGFAHSAGRAEGSEERERLLQAGGSDAAAPCPAVGALRGGAPLGADAAAVADPGRGVQRELGRRLPDRVQGDAGVARLLQTEGRESPGPAELRQPTCLPSPPPLQDDRGRSRRIDPVVFPLLDGNAVEFRIRRKISAEEAEDLRVMFELWLRKIVER